MTFGIGIFDFGADRADEVNRPDGIKLLRNFCGFTGVPMFLACFGEGLPMFLVSFLKILPMNLI